MSAEKKFLGRAEILGADDRRFKEVEVPEWGGTVLLRAISGAERDSFEASIIERNGKDVEVNHINLRAKLVALSIVNPDGSRVFSDDDIKALGQKSAAALDRVFAAAQQLSGLSKADVKELAEGFGGAQGGGSTSA